MLPVPFSSLNYDFVFCIDIYTYIHTLILILKKGEHNMCESHLGNEEYECIHDNDLSPLLKNRIIAYAKKYQNLLTENEYKTLTRKNL